MAFASQAVAALSPRVFSVAGSGSLTLSGAGLPATDAGGEFRDVAPLPHGSFLVSGGVVRRVEADGAITTVAGDGSFSFFQEQLGDGGPATSANLDPEGVAGLPGGGFLVADTTHHRVRLVSSTGVISTVAGSGTIGPLFPPLSGPAPQLGDGGPATSASLDYPTSVAVLPGGGYLIADVGDNRVRMVDAHGIITTVAGTGTAGFSGDGGPATTAALNGPSTVAVLPHGGFLIAEQRGNRVRRVDAHGVITAVAGTGRQGTDGDGGRATHAALTSPGGLAVLPGGGFLIAEAGRVRRVDSHGIISTLAGAAQSVRSGNVIFSVEPARAQWSGLSDGLGGPALSAQITPLSLAVEPSGSVLVGAYTHVLMLATGSHPLAAVAIRPPAIVNGFIQLNVAASEPGQERIVVRAARDGRRVATFTEAVGAGVSGFRLPRTPGGTLIVRVTLDSHGRLATDETTIVSGHVLPVGLARAAIAFRCCSGKPPVVQTAHAKRAQEGEETPPSLLSCHRFSATRVDCQWGWQHRCAEAASAVLRNALVYLTVYVPCTFARHPRHQGAPWIAPLL
jgi:hypothetical protein